MAASLLLLAAVAAPALTLPKGIALHTVATWAAGQGLPADTVTAVTQTGDGYLWIGTEAGLARFDGVRFTTYRTTNTPALASHVIRALLTERQGRLWIGTDAGVVRLHNGGFEPAGLPERSVHALCEDATGGLWAGTDAGVFIRRGEGAFVALPAGPETPRIRPNVLFADQAGRIWLAYPGRAGAVVATEDSFIPFHASGKLTDEVLAIAQTPDGALWFGTPDGLVQWRNGEARRDLVNLTSNHGKKYLGHSDELLRNETNALGFLATGGISATF